MGTDPTLFIDMLVTRAVEALMEHRSRSPTLAISPSSRWSKGHPSSCRAKGLLEEPQSPVSVTASGRGTHALRSRRHHFESVRLQDPQQTSKTITVTRTALGKSKMYRTNARGP
jgi:hypothetical protein